VDGSKRLESTLTAAAAEPVLLGECLAGELLAHGAGELVAASRSEPP